VNIPGKSESQVRRREKPWVVSLQVRRGDVRQALRVAYRGSSVTMVTKQRSRKPTTHQCPIVVLDLFELGECLTLETGEFFIVVVGAQYDVSQQRAKGGPIARDDRSREAASAGSHVDAEGAAELVDEEVQLLGRASPAGTTHEPYQQTSQSFLSF